MERPSLRSWLPPSARHSDPPLTSRISSFAPGANAVLVAASEDGVSPSRPNSGEYTQKIRISDPALAVPSDGKVDQWGRFWVGTSAVAPTDRARHDGSIFAFDTPAPWLRVHERRRVKEAWQLPRLGLTTALVDPTEA
jgi:sugar lactone lactonase YvrE